MGYGLDRFREILEELQEEIPKLISMSDEELMKVVKSRNETKGTPKPIILDEVLNLIQMEMDRDDSEKDKGKQSDTGLLEEDTNLQVVGVIVNECKSHPPLLQMSNNITLGCNSKRKWTTYNTDSQVAVEDEDLEMFDTMEDLVTRILLGVGMYKKTYSQEESDILQEWLRENDKFYKVGISGTLLRG